MSALRNKIGHLSTMELFHDFTPDQMQEIDRATRMQSGLGVDLEEE
jgi:hypothetical protein